MQNTGVYTFCIGPHNNGLKRCESAGPRTLCNACGVKHLRHSRGLPRTDIKNAAHRAVHKSKGKKQVYLYVTPMSAAIHIWLAFSTSLPQGMTA